MEANIIATAFAAIGHVDHGKSTLLGRILYDSGYITQRDAEKLQKEAIADKMESWWLSRIFDIEKIEQTRGKTHEFMYIDFTYKDRGLRLIDVPGHRLLISQMIGGVAMADIALLVVSGRKGEFEQGLAGQTMEHILIARGLGIKDIIVVINKMDSVAWDKSIYKNIVSSVSKKLKPLKMSSIHFVPVSALTGENINFVKDDEELPLLDLMLSLHIQKRENKRVAVIDNIIVTKFMFYNLQSIASAGMKFIIHTIDGTYNGEILKIKNGQKTLVTPKDANNIVIVMIKIDEDINDIDSKLIIRDGDSTIGFAEVLTKKK